MKGSAKEEPPPPLTCSGGRDMALPSRRTLQLKVSSAAPSTPRRPSAWQRTDRPCTRSSR